MAEPGTGRVLLAALCAGLLQQQCGALSTEALLPANLSVGYNSLVAQKIAAGNRTQCLLWQGHGCHSIKDEAACLRSRDGSRWAQYKGRQIQGQPCVWCGGQPCTHANEHLCEPLDWVMGIDYFGPAPDFSVAMCEPGQNWTEHLQIEYRSKLPESFGSEDAFRAMDGGEGRACRGSSPSDMGEAQPVNPSGEEDEVVAQMAQAQPDDFTMVAYNVWTADTLERCKAFCTEGCTGVEYRAQDDYCEVWHVPVLYSAEMPGYECYTVRPTAMCTNNLPTCGNLTGLCCPDSHGFMLGCCSHTPHEFRMVTSGTCLSNGLFPITVQRWCEEASAVVGISDHTATVTNETGRPEGCYVFNSGKLAFSNQSLNAGKGAETSEDMAARHPICMRTGQKYVRLARGSCASMDLAPVNDKVGCEEAARYLGLAAPGAEETGDFMVPEGCYILNGYKLLLSTNSANLGKGAETSTQGMVRRPVCMSPEHQLGDGTQRAGIDWQESDLPTTPPPVVSLPPTVTSTITTTTSRTTTTTTPTTREPPAWERSPRPMEGQMRCLKWLKDGCSAAGDLGTCLASRDGSNVTDVAGLSVKDEPCIWCGGGPCMSSGGSLCGPYDLLMNGEGVVFDKFLAKDSFMVASCADETPEPEEDTRCLNSTNSGCGELRSEASCLASVDGGSAPAAYGLRRHGEPCVWCGGLVCTSSSDNLCEPFDYVVHGEGRAFVSFHARAIFKVATCRGPDQPRAEVLAAPKVTTTAMLASTTTAAAATTTNTTEEGSRGVLPGVNCWDPCGRKVGYCEWCGSGNACCQEAGAEQPPECKGAVFATWHHECVVPVYQAVSSTSTTVVATTTAPAVGVGGTVPPSLTSSTTASPQSGAEPTTAVLASTTKRGLEVAGWKIDAQMVSESPDGASSTLKASGADVVSMLKGAMTTTREPPAPIPTTTSGTTTTASTTPAPSPASASRSTTATVGEWSNVLAPPATDMGDWSNELAPGKRTVEQLVNMSHEAGSAPAPPSASANASRSARAGGNASSGGAVSADSTVRIQFTLQSVAYDRLMTQETELESLQAAVKRTIAGLAGNGVAPSDVAVKLLAGSVIVKAAVPVRAGPDVARTVASSLQRSACAGGAALAEALGKGLNGSVASTGTLTVEAIDVRHPSSGTNLCESAAQEPGPSAAQWALGLAAAVLALLCVAGLVLVRHRSPVEEGTRKKQKGGYVAGSQKSAPSKLTPRRGYGQREVELDSPETAASSDEELEAPLTGRRDHGEKASAGPLKRGSLFGGLEAPSFCEHLLRVLRRAAPRGGYQALEEQAAPGQAGDLDLVMVTPEGLSVVHLPRGHAPPPGVPIVRSDSMRLSGP